MPKKKKVANVQYTNFQNFLIELENQKTLGDKLEYIFKSMLNHGGARGRDLSLAQFTEVARQKVAEVLSKKKTEEKLDETKVDRDVLAAEMFLGNPTEYIKGEANDLITNTKDDETKKNCENLISHMNKDFKERIEIYDQYPSYYGVRARLESSFGGKDKLDELYQATQPSRFSKIFATYSAEWSALEQAYETFNNPNKYGFAQMDHLEESTNNYLKHKFPKWKPGEEIPAEAYSKLNKTELAKVNFSIGILNAIKDQRETEKDFKPLVEESKAKDIKYEDLPEQKDEIDIDQASFQSQLLEDTNLDNDESLISSSEESKDLINESSIEEEQINEPSIK